MDGKAATLCVLRGYLYALLLTKIVIVAAESGNSTDAAPYLLFTTQNTIYRHHFSNSSTEVVLRPFDIGIVGISFHYRLDSMFWINNAFLQRGILAANLNGSDERVLTTGSLEDPVDLVVDWLNDRLYWVDQNLRQVEEYDLKTGHRVVVLTTGEEGTSSPNALTLLPYPNYGWIYWSDRTRKTIERVSVTGDDRSIVITGLECVAVLTIDYSTVSLYWIDQCFYEISSLRLDGDKKSYPFDNPIFFASGLLVYNDTFFWSAYNGVFRLANTEGATESTVYNTAQTVRCTGVELVHASVQPHVEQYIDIITKTNEEFTFECSLECVHGECIFPGLCACDAGWRGEQCDTDLDECERQAVGCEYQCSNTVGSFQCVCPDGYILAEDGLLCEVAPTTTIPTSTAAMPDTLQSSSSSSPSMTTNLSPSSSSLSPSMTTNLSPSSSSLSPSSSSLSLGSSSLSPGSSSLSPGSSSLSPGSSSLSPGSSSLSPNSSSLSPGSSSLSPGSSSLSLGSSNLSPSSSSLSPSSSSLSPSSSSLSPSSSNFAESIGITTSPAPSSASLDMTSSTTESQPLVSQRPSPVISVTDSSLRTSSGLSTTVASATEPSISTVHSTSVAETTPPPLHSSSRPSGEAATTSVIVSSVESTIATATADTPTQSSLAHIPVTSTAATSRPSVQLSEHVSSLPRTTQTLTRSSATPSLSHSTRSTLSAVATSSQEIRVSESVRLMSSNADSLTASVSSADVEIRSSRRVYVSPTSTAVPPYKEEEEEEEAEGAESDNIQGMFIVAAVTIVAACLIAAAVVILTIMLSVERWRHKMFYNTSVPKPTVKITYITET